MKSLIYVLSLIVAGPLWAAEVLNAPAEFSRQESPKTVIRQAYSLRDLEGLKAIDAHNGRNVEKLKSWRGNFQFGAADKPGDSIEPWLQDSALDLNVPEHAPILSQIMLKYILQGWFSAQNAHNRNDQFRDNDYRTWCSTPWVVDGEGGREAVHGLTRELTLKPNPVYPADGVTLVEMSDPNKRPQGWGVPFFNKPVCDVYNRVFGPPKNPIVPPHFADFKSPDGFVSFKLHFNALENWQQYAPWNGAYSWWAHVTNKPSSALRRLQEIPLIQISISLKDSRLRGTTADADYWVMLNYTYDPQFTNNELNLPHLPEAFRHMKPVGIQKGFEPAQTQLFLGAKTNYMRDGKFIGDGPLALLNGPADNAYSSCMGCHAGFSLSEYIQKEFSEAQFPGRSSAWKITFYDKESFNFVTGKYGKGMDFNLQLSNASDRVAAWLKSK